tara:strand:- start:72 stop:509 length:438 start_codon:yes stop_codon:yes gene_type:complete
VFDPLAISLVIASNFAFDKAYPKKKYKENLYGEEVLDLSPRDISTIVKASENPSPPNEALKKAAEKERKEFDWDAAEKRMEIIGQNGNDGEHYSEFDLNKDGVVDAQERLLMISKLRDMQKDFSGEILNKLKNLEKEIHNFTIKK